MIYGNNGTPGVVQRIRKKAAEFYKLMIIFIKQHIEVKRYNIKTAGFINFMPATTPIIPIIPEIPDNPRFKSIPSSGFLYRKSPTSGGA